MGAIIQEGQTPPSHVNNALRALGSMVAREIAFKASAISASVSTNLCVSNLGLCIPVIGAGNTASFGSVPGEFPNAAVFRFLEFSSSASLSHGPALRLIGGVPRRTQPGDIGGYLHVDNTDSWVALFYSPASGSPLGGSISLSTVNAIVGRTVTLDATSVSASAISVANVQEFPRQAFSAHKKGTNQTSASHSLTFGTEDFDIGGAYASSAWVPAAGKSRLKVQVQLTWTTAGTGNVILSINKNGTAFREKFETYDTSDDSAHTIDLDCLVDANGTDSFTAAAVLSGTGVASVIAGATPRSFFCGERV
jgi:hypothetical protein